MTKKRGTKVLINFFHPNFSESRGNKILTAAVKKLPEVTFRHVDSSYDSFVFDTAKEQNLLLEHDVIVVQHPIMWFSSPPLLKAWYDQVLAHGWAFPAEESKLAGKTLQLAVTTAGDADVYRSSGRYGFTVSEMMRPQQMTAVCCGMNFAPVFSVHGVMPVQCGGVSDKFLEEQAERYAVLIKQFTKN